MKLIIFVGVIANAFCACHSLEPAKSKQELDKNPLDSTKAIVRFISDTFKVGIFKRADLINKFDKFYEGKDGHFFIRSYGYQRSEKHEFQPVEVFVEVPRLDSATFKDFDSYFVDSSKVICVLPNSDGGNYVLLKNADPKSFQAFRNAYVGRISTKDRKSIILI